MANKPNESKQDKPLLKGILSDCYETILIPKTKQIFTSMVVEGVYAVADFLSNVAQKKIMNGTTSYSSSSSRPRPQTNHSANRQALRSGYSQRQDVEVKQDIGMRSATKLQYIVFKDPITAKEFEKALKEHIRQFGVLRVSDFYDKYNQFKSDDEKYIKPIHVDVNFGWTNEEDIHYVTTRDGYWFNLPVPQEVIA